MNTLYNFVKKYFKEIVIIFLVIHVINLGNYFGHRNDDIEIINVDGKDFELVSQKIDTVLVEKEIKVTEYVPTTIYKTDTVRVEIPSDVDTTAILEDYFASYTVVDTLDLTYEFPSEVTDEEGNKPESTLGFGIMTDVISQNRIQSRQVDWSFRVPTVYNTTIVKELPKNEFYLGGGLSFSEQNFIQNVSIGLAWKTKKQEIVNFDFGVGNYTNKEVTEFIPYIGVKYLFKFGDR